VKGVFKVSCIKEERSHGKTIADPKLSMREKKFNNFQMSVDGETFMTVIFFPKFSKTFCPFSPVSIYLSD
jgi:hypothetical protein